MRGLTIPADCLINRIVEHDGKPLVLGPYHCTRHAGFPIESQHREAKADSLPILDRSSGDNVDTACAYVPDQIPIRSRLDGIFRTEQGDVAGMSASVGNCFHFLFTLSRS